MPKPVPLDKRNEFRAHYLLSGNASESAREVGLPDRTGRDIAAELRKDETFADERRDLRAHYLDDLVALRMRMAHHAAGEATSAKPLIVEFEKGGQVIDRRPDWAKVVLDAEKNAHNLAKIESPQDSGQPTEVHISVSGPVEKGASGE